MGARDRDSDDPRREGEYYRHRLDEAVAENLRLNRTATALQLELIQKRQSLSLLSDFRRRIDARDSVNSILAAAVASIATTLPVDRVLALVPAEAPDMYRPEHRMGLPEERAGIVGQGQVRLPPQFAAGEGSMLVSEDGSVQSALVEPLREVLDAPYLVCVPVAVDGSAIGAIAVGRLLRAPGHVHRPFDQGDVDTLRAIAQFVSAAAKNARQVEEVERLGRLRRFLSPQLAEVVLSGGDALLESHRREITVVFCDLRGFTALSETAEPEVVIGILREYHAAMGELIFRFGGTLEHFAGDGIMVFFNDPVPYADHVQRAIRMGVAMRERVTGLASEWRRRGFDLGLGIGIAVGFATLGKIGFEGRVDYGAVGSVVNLAARLCAVAGASQILVSQRTLAAADGVADAEPVPDVELKGFHSPVRAFNVRSAS